MKFEDRGNEKRIVFDEYDTDAEKHLIESALQTLRAIIVVTKEGKGEGK